MLSGYTFYISLTLNPSHSYILSTSIYTSNYFLYFQLLHTSILDALLLHFYSNVARGTAASEVLFVTCFNWALAVTGNN